MIEKVHQTGSGVRTELLQPILENLRRFAGREIFASVHRDSESSDPEMDRDAIKKRLGELRDRLQERPGQVAGKPEMIRRWLAPPGGMSAARLRQWTLSRHCLIEVLEAMLEQLEGSERGSSILLSLAHTKGLSASAGVFVAQGENPHIVGLGMDIEPKKRKASALLAERIRSDEDLADPLDLITIWTAKEACLKADPRPPSALNAYALKCFADTFSTGVLQAMSDRIDFRIWMDDLDGFRLAIALAYATHPQAVVQHAGQD